MRFATSIFCFFAVFLEVFGNRQVMEECKAKFSNFDPRTAPPDSQDGKCFSACMMKGTGIMNADNTFNLEKDYEKIDKIFAMKSADEIQKIKQFAKECSSQSYTGTECDIADAYRHCAISKAQQAGIQMPFGPPRPKP